MKHKVWHKYALSYFTALLFIFLIMNLVGYEHTKRNIIEDEQEKLYEEAKIIVNEYLTRYNDGTLSVEEYSRQLKSLAVYMSIDVWVVTREGDVTIRASEGVLEQPINIRDAEDILDQNYAEVESLEGLAEEPTICADGKSTRLNSSHHQTYRMASSA